MLLAAGALIVALAACGPKPATDSSPASADAVGDIIYGDPGAFAPTQDDLRLMEAAYAVARENTTADSTSVMLAEVYAEEALVLSLAGAREQAMFLWAEAISLLEGRPRESRAEELPEPRNGSGSINRSP